MGGGGGSCGLKNGENVIMVIFSLKSVCVRACVCVCVRACVCVDDDGSFRVCVV